MVQPAIIIRKANSDDIKYAEQATKIINDAYRLVYAHYENNFRCTVDEMVQCIAKSGNPNTLLLAFEDDTVVGTALILPVKEIPNEAELGLISVSPLHQSRGIGGKLIHSGLTIMKELGFDCAMMHLLEGRPDILNWYKKLGFIDTGERAPYPKPELLKNKYFITLKKSI